MFKSMLILFCTGFVTLLPGAHALERRADGTATSPLYSAVFLKPGESQQLVLSAPEYRIGARDRTTYYFTAVNEKGEKTSDLKEITITADYQRMGELWDIYGGRYIAIKFSATADAAPGKYLIRVHAVPFGLPPTYDSTVRLTIGK